MIEGEKTQELQVLSNLRVKMPRLTIKTFYDTPRRYFRLAPLRPSEENVLLSVKSMLIFQCLNFTSAAT